MTKTQGGVPLTHNSIIKLSRFHVKKSCDNACHVLSLIKLRLAFAGSFVVMRFAYDKDIHDFKSQPRFHAKLLMSF